MPDEGILEGQIGSGKGPEPQASEEVTEKGETLPEATEGQAEEGSPQSGKEQAVAGLPEGLTLEALPDAYKSLQGEYTKNQQAYKELQKSLEPYGGPDQILQWANYLQNNPSFAKWVQAEQQRQALGVQGDAESEVDEETQKALEIVQRVADQKANQLYQEKVAPIENSLKEERLAENMAKMDADPVYADWHEFRDEMAEIAESLPESKQDNPSLEDLQDLYWMAVRKTGKLESVMSKSYEKLLKSKQSKSTDRPASKVNEGAKIKAKSIREAFEAAKREAS